MTERNSLEEILPNDIDLSGWELKKSSKIILEINPPMLEWLRSPIRLFRAILRTVSKLRTLSNSYFNQSPV